MAPLLLTSGLVRHEAVLHSCGTGPVGDEYRLVTVHTHGDFIVLPQVVGTMTCYPTQSHYPDTEPTCAFPIPILIMLSTWLGSDKYQF